MASTHLTPCFDQLAPVIASDVVQRDLDGYVEGPGIGNKLGADWKPGNSHDDRAYAVAYGAVLEHEKTHGPEFERRVAAFSAADQTAMSRNSEMIMQWRYAAADPGHRE